MAYFLPVSYSINRGNEDGGGGRWGGMEGKKRRKKEETEEGSCAGGKRKRVISKKYKNKNKTCYTLNVKMEIVCKILKTTNVIDLF